MRLCAWCDEPIPEGARRDAVCCSTRCRQARHRFTTGVGVASRRSSETAPLRLAVADPPYPGRSQRYYGEHPDYAGEVDHADLVDRLAAFDGWALCTAADALPEVLRLCPPGSRVAAWHHGARPNRRAMRPLNAWEPVIYYGGRVAPAVRDDASRSAVVQGDGFPYRTDSLVYVARARTTDPARVIGAKPAAYCRWIFELLGAAPGDDLIDIYPGSGGIARAWDTYTREATDR